MIPTLKERIRAETLTRAPVVPSDTAKVAAAKTTIDVLTDKPTVMGGAGIGVYPGDTKAPAVEVPATGSGTTEQVATTDPRELIKEWAKENTEQSIISKDALTALEESIGAAKVEGGPAYAVPVHNREDKIDLDKLVWWAALVIGIMVLLGMVF